MNNSYRSILLITLLVCLMSSVLASTTTKWVNTDIVRNIDLSTQIAKQAVQIKAKNQGDATNIYTIALPSTLEGEQKIKAFINDDESKPSLNIVNTYTKQQNKQSYQLYDIELDQKYSSGSSLTLKIKITSMKQVVAYPAEIEQGQAQLVRFVDNAYFTSPYDTETQKTTIKLASSKVESYTNTDAVPGQLKGQTVVYGPFKNVAPLGFAQFTVHYENNQSFLRLTRLTKEYEVSHWGNVAVETFYWVLHGGAKLKGAFSRLDFQRNPSPSHIADITETVPRQAADFYYRDDIGNISTSQYYVSGNSQTLKISPRFPLLGGWKNEFYTGYNLPTQPFLSQDSSSGLYHLNVSAGVNIENVFVEDHSISFVLPEGATDIQVLSAPFHQYTRSDSIRKTFFDTVGRPVVTIHTDFTSAENYNNIVIAYNLSPLAIFHEPLLAIGAVFTICLVVILSTRLDLSFNKQ